MPTLFVMEHSGDFAEWVGKKTIDGPENSVFSFQNNLANVVGAAWQLSSVPVWSSVLSSSFPGFLGGATFQPPMQGKAKVVNVNWKQLVPATPAAGTRYYFRVVTYKGANNTNPVLASNMVVITIKKSDFVVEFTPEGLGQTVKQKRPELFELSPMSIEIDLQKLYIGNPNESHDEPYLFVVVMYVDGTTINPLKMSTSFVRVDSKHKTVGNVPDVDQSGEDLEQASTAKIPAATGHFEKTIKPIGVDIAANLEDVDGSIADSMATGTAVYVMVVAMEGDNTSTAAVNAAHDAMVDGLTKTVNGIVQSTKDLKSGVKFDPEKISNEIKDKVIDAAVNKTLTPGWWTPIILTIKSGEFFDPDDFVGAGFKKFTFEDLVLAGTNDIPFELELSNTPLSLAEQIAQAKIPFIGGATDWEGSYTVKGRIRRKPG